MKTLINTHLIIFSSLLCSVLTLKQNGQESATNHLQNIIKRNPKIVGGVKARPDEFPFQASLRYEDHHVCGAVIVDPKGAITAAHCVEKGLVINDSAFSVVGGEYKLDKIDRGEQILKVSAIKVHPLYDPTELENDIAYLHLEKEFIWSRFVKKIKINSDTTQIPENSVLTSSGWGWTKNDQEGLSNVLQKVDLPIVPNDQCQKAYKKATQKTRLPITINDDSMLCAGDFLQGGLDACKGDSGGPLIYRVENKTHRGDRFKNLEFLMGITSFGLGCGQIGLPGVYTKINHFKNWLQITRYPGQRPQETSPSQCGGMIFVDQQSELVYRNPGENQKTCIWLLLSSSRGQFSLTLTNLSSGINWKFARGNLSLHNGLSLEEDGRQINERHLGKELIISYSQVILVFTSQPGQNFRFKLQFEKTQHEFDVKFRTRLISLGEQIQKSMTLPVKYSYPKYWGKLYSANHRRYVVLKPVFNKFVQVSLEFLDIGDHQDSLHLYKYSNEENKFILLRRYTGVLGLLEGNQNIFQSNVNSPILILFQSDHERQGHGFQISISYHDT